MIRSHLAAAIACLEELQLIPGGKELLSHIASPSEIQLILPAMRDKLKTDHHLQKDDFHGSLRTLGTTCKHDIHSDWDLLSPGGC